MYYKQLPCIYHPGLNITNFCQDQQCLMPLCPSCIRQHTEYHQQIKTKPSYFNIYEALAETDTLITNSICNLEKDKKRNVRFELITQSELIFKINRLPAIIHEKVQQSKAMALKIVEQAFSELQKDTLDALNRINEELSLYSLRKSQTLEQSIVTNLQDLYDLAEGLKTQSCLSDMIFFLKEKRFQVEDLHTDLSNYLYSNESYQPFLQISKEAQHSLAVVIHRMFKLDPKEKPGLNANKSFGGGKPDLESSSYHINLTPSKIKKQAMYSLEKQKTTNPHSRFGQGLISSNSRPNRINSYQNYNEYQEYIQRSRQQSKQKGDNSFRQINIRQKERKVYYQDIGDDFRQKNQELTRRLGNNQRYPTINKF